MRVMPCQEISDVIVCKFHIIFICGGVMRWIASEIYGFLLIGKIINKKYLILNNGIHKSGIIYSSAFKN